MKGKKNKKEQEEKQEEEEDHPQVCPVCRLSRWDTQDFLQLKCISCSSTVHKNCYYPDIQNKDRPRFKCDPCKKKSSKNKDKQPPMHTCSHCGGTGQMLKDVGSNEWMHVLCALTSPRVSLVSYLNLNFVAKPSHKTLNKNKKCLYCEISHKKDGKGQGLPCYLDDCKCFLHLTCVVDYVGSSQENEAAPTVGLLDKNEGSLLYWLKIRQQKNHFLGLGLLSKEIKEPRYLVCGIHNEDGSFQWCTCNSDLKDDLVDWKQCQLCSRWYHPKCAFKNQKEQQCRGCKENDIYLKNLKIPQLLSHAAKTEKLVHLDKASIKFLNHFCFKPSEKLQKMFSDKKNQFYIERYFLRQFLEEYEGKEINEGEEEKLLEVLYYLLKKEYKKESQISSEDMEEMMSQLSGKGPKFEWSQQKSEKIQKKFKDFISSKLKRVKKDSIRDIRMKLNQFLQFNKQKQRNVKQISSYLYPILQAINQEQTWNKIQDNIEVKDHHELLHFFINSNLSEKDITSIMEGIKVLLAARNNNRTLNENQYHQIMLKKYKNLSSEKEKELKTIYINLSKGTKAKRLFQEKKDILKDIQNKFAKCKPEQKIKLRNTAIKKGIFVPFSSKMFKLEADTIEAEICKKNFLKNYNPPEPTEITTALKQLNKLILMDQATGVFTKEERITFKDTYNKYNFYHSTIMFVTTFKQFIPQEFHPLMEPSQEKMVQNGSQRFQRIYAQQRLEEKLAETFTEWPMTPEYTVNALSLLRQAAKNQIKWTENESQIINAFLDTIVFRIQRMVEDGLITIKSNMLTQIKQISIYLGSSEKYSRYIELCLFYESWKQNLQSKFKNIENVLEDNDLCEEMKEVIEEKMSQIGTIAHRIDLSQEMRKLKVIRVWITFSQKFLGNQRSTTIAAIQSAKSLMEKIQYPKNSIRKDIQRLEKEGRSLNKRISRFLEKHKLVEMELYEELRFVQNKMTLKEANELQRDLQNSELDIEIQLNQLKEQISNSLSFTNDIDQTCRQAKNSDVLSKLRKDLLESPFNVCTSSQYEALLHRYYELRCSEYDGSLSKKDYFRLLNHGGTSAITLLNKTQYLLNTYNHIDNAEKEILNSKPKNDLLLSQDIDRYRNDLSGDLAQLSKIQKYLTQFNKYKNQFASYKIERADVEKYNQLLNQISRLPIQSSDIKAQINKMKRDLDELIIKTRNYMPENAKECTQYQSPFTNAMVTKYQNLGMRCSSLDKFQELVVKSQEIAELNRDLSFQNYKMFSLKCASVPQLRNNDEFYRQRQLAFQRIHSPYLEHSDPLIEVALTLIEQGGYLIKRPRNAQRILPILMKIHCKSYKWERAQMEDMNHPQLKEEEDEHDSFEDDCDDDEDLDDSSLLEDFDDDDSGYLDSNVNLISDEVEIQRSEESPKQGSRNKEEKSRKRPHPKDNECVISDDD